MDIKYVPVLADAMKEYYEGDELVELCDLFDIEVETDFHGKPAWIKLARNLIEKIGHGNNRRFLETLMPSLVGRASQGVARSSYERQDYHREMLDKIERLMAELQGHSVPSEITVPEDSPFTAKSEVRDFLTSAETPILIVDNYVGTGTLDCLRDVQQRVRLLTGDRPSSIEPGFERVLQDFRSEGHSIEIRKHGRLHDRHFIFNDKCWLVGSSLKDAGKKTFNVIECVDNKDMIVADIEEKWAEAIEYSE